MRGQYAQLAYLMRSSFSEQDFNHLMAEKMDEYIQQTMKGGYRRKALKPGSAKLKSTP